MSISIWLHHHINFVLLHLFVYWVQDVKNLSKVNKKILTINYKTIKQNVKFVQS